MSLLHVENLKVYFPLGKGKTVKAVDGVSFDLEQGEVLGIVGESGCGKSTLVRAIMRLLPITEGSIEILGQNLANLTEKELRPFRKNFQMVFQDPEASLNPRFTVGEVIGEPLKVYSQKSKKEILFEVQELMEQVGLNPSMIRRYPHEFSGGQRQRISIARALSLKPKLIVCDEAVSALDVSIQAQIVNLLNDLKQRFNLTYLFISHDLSVTRYISDKIMVMYLGKVVELGRTEEVILHPKHPYTQALLAAVPQYKKIAHARLKGEIPSPVNPPEGCRFRTRCPLVQAGCEKEPLLKTQGQQKVACHFPL